MTLPNCRTAHFNSRSKVLYGHSLLAPAAMHPGSCQTSVTGYRRLVLSQPIHTPPRCHLLRTWAFTWRPVSKCVPGLTYQMDTNSYSSRPSNSLATKARPPSHKAQHPGRCNKRTSCAIPFADIKQKRLAPPSGRPPRWTPAKTAVRTLSRHTHFLSHANADRDAWTSWMWSQAGQKPLRMLSCLSVDSTLRTQFMALAAARKRSCKYAGEEKETANQKQIVPRREACIDVCCLASTVLRRLKASHILSKAIAHVAPSMLYTVRVSLQSSLTKPTTA